MATDAGDDVFSSVHWSAPEAPKPSNDRSDLDGEPEHVSHSSAFGDDAERTASTSAPRPFAPQRALSVLELRPDGFIKIDVCEPLKELEGTKDVYISYAVVGSTSLPNYSSKSFATRRRYGDFVFLHDHLVKDFPACVVPPLPGKHRLEYVTGDRFSQEFVERRRQDLKRFLNRIARHPTLARSTLLQAFFESTEWSVRMHQHLAHPPQSEGPPSMLDNLSDSLVNAFTKIRKPDERFVEMREAIDRYDDSLTGVDRIESRVRSRICDLSADYDDMAASVQGLSYLESGMTEPLSKFETALLDFGEALRLMSTESIEPFLYHLHSLQNYSTSFRGVLKLRDQKQVDFEELSAALSTLTAERDRLAAGMSPGGLGIGSFIKAKVDTIRGADTDYGRRERMAKLDTKIKEMQDAVMGAQEQSDGFNDEVLREQDVFQLAKRSEMKELLNSLADGHIAMYKASIEAFERCEPALMKIRTL